VVAVKEAPLLVYGESGRLTKDQDLKRLEGDKLWNLASTISSVYFDSDDFRLYRERLARHEGAQLFRIRWYGDKPSGDELVFLELKTHHEKWINTTSVKERVNIRERDVYFFLSTNFSTHDAKDMVQSANPKLTGKSLTKAVDLLVTMHNLVIKFKLRPCVRSKYQRVAFQSPESNELRLTVDRNIVMIDETSAQPGAWCLPDSSIKDTMIKAVPYNVFEVKLAGSETPASIEELETQGVIIESAKFSKFLTGAAAFNSPKLKSLPYWSTDSKFQCLFTPARDRSAVLSSKSSGTDRTDTTDTGTSSFTEDKEFGAAFKKRAHIWSSFLRPSQENRIAPKRPARVEPKSYFANERTFIQWISACLLLLTVSVILLEYDTYHPEYHLLKIGIALLACAVTIILYSLYSYKRRVGRLERGDAYGYIDHAGPGFLALAILMGVVAIGAVFISAKIDRKRTRRNASFAVKAQDGVCIQRELGGLSLLEYQPSDVFVSDNNQGLLIPSLDTIRIYGETGGPSSLITIPGTDLEGITMVDGKVYALGETNKESSEIIELVWGKGGSLNLVQRWEISTPRAEGIAFIPGSPGKLYVAGDLVADSLAGDFTQRGVFDVYDLPETESEVPLARHRLNSHLISGDLIDSKISSLQYFEGILYVLHDNSKLVRSWDIETGELLSEFRLPPFSKKWEGLALERRSSDGGQLRGGRDEQLWLHLTLDSPPQVWSVLVQEPQRGKIVLPSCAVP